MEEAEADNSVCSEGKEERRAERGSCAFCLTKTVDECREWRKQKLIIVCAARARRKGGQKGVAVHSA